MMNDIGPGRGGGSDDGLFVIFSSCSRGVPTAARYRRPSVRRGGGGGGRTISPDTSVNVRRRKRDARKSRGRRRFSGRITVQYTLDVLETTGTLLEKSGGKPVVADTTVRIRIVLIK